MSQRLDLQSEHLQEKLAQLEARLQDLEQREAVRQLLAEYCRVVDLADFDGMARLFSQGVHYSVAPWDLEILGHEALLDFFRQFHSGDLKDAHHFCSNQEIRQTERGYAARSYFHVVGIWGDQSIVEWGTYTDSLIYEEGGWKFAKRHVEIQVLSSLEKGWAGSERIIYGC